jgi:class 3 adenylate cyclase
MPTAEPISKDLTLREFLEKYPWPAEWLKKGKPMHFFWKYDLPVPVEKLWPYIADLSSFNRRVGMGEMKFTEKNGRLQGFAVNVGKKNYWEEVPWEWEYGRQFSHARVYSEGLPYYMRARYLFEELEPGKCRLYAYLSFIPRGPLSRLLIHIGLQQMKKGYGKALKEITTAIQRQERLKPPAVPAQLPPAVREKLNGIRHQLVEGGTRAEITEKLIRYVETEPDESIYRIRVKPLAREWKVSEKDLLLAFLNATRLGLFNLTWDVLCPHCRGVRDEVKGLGQLPKRGNCEVCKIDFDATSFNALEITFHVHPSIRPVQKRLYCAAEPATKPHIKMQKTLLPGSELALPTLLGLGRYRLRIGGRELYNLLDINEGSGETEVKWKDSLAEQNLNSAHFPTVVLHNTSSEPRMFILEENRVDLEALRPVDLFSFQGFRDLFSQEALAADIKLEVGVQTVLFTDLVGSTKFYETEGDTVAFTEVRAHFLKAYDVVKKHGGAVVKTIGDAVMAAFSDSRDALAAAVELQEYFNGNNPESRLRLRVTLNTGSCLAVNLNSSIDYFGNTVNLGAKIQSIAEAGQIGFTEDFYQSQSVRDFLTEKGLKAEKLNFTQKWSGKTLPVYRVDVA